MKMPDMARRAPGPEMMDDPNVDIRALDHAMAHLKVINHVLNGYGPSLAGIARVLPSGCTKFSLLDVGCGSGDTLRVIAKWARKQKLEADLIGIELSERSARRAAEECAPYPEITILHQDFTQMGAQRFDVVHCALMLHHFYDEAAAAGVLEQMAFLARYGIVVNDLHRHALAWRSIHWLTRIFSRSEILRNDAPLSVARGFIHDDLLSLGERANLAEVHLSWHWAFRWLLTAKGRADG